MYDRLNFSVDDSLSFVASVFQKREGEIELVSGGMVSYFLKQVLKRVSCSMSPIFQDKERLGNSVVKFSD